MTGERRQQFLQQFGRRVRASRILKGLSLQRCFLCCLLPRVIFIF